MNDVVVVCTDGSELADQAALAGVALLGGDVHLVVVTVIDDDDPSLVSGSGFAGGTMSPGAFDELNAQREAAGQSAVTELVRLLGRDDVRTELLRGEAGAAVCDFATDV